MEEEKKEKEKENLDLDKTCKVIEDKLKELTDSGYKLDVSKYWGDTVDILKDIYEIKLKKEELNMYQGYGRGYGDDSYGRARDSRGRFMEGGSYGRRGVPGTGRGRYRGEEIMDEMAYHYGNYSEGAEQYGADQKTMESFKYMLKSFKDYYKHLKQEASSQQEVQMLEDVAREISEM
jgi:hypothetical protein